MARVPTVEDFEVEDKGSNSELRKVEAEGSDSGLDGVVNGLLRQLAQVLLGHVQHLQCMMTAI